MNESPLPLPPRPAGRVLDAHLELLDRLVHDPDDVPVTTVDDVELSDPADATALDPDDPPVLTNLLAGPVLGTRIFGGRPPKSRFERIPWDYVTDIGVTIRISRPADSLDLTWLERWVSQHIIARIPGGRHDPE